MIQMVLNEHLRNEGCMPPPRGDRMGFVQQGKVKEIIGEEIIRGFLLSRLHAKYVHTRLYLIFKTDQLKMVLLCKNSHFTLEKLKPKGIKSALYSYMLNGKGLMMKIHFCLMPVLDIVSTD